MGVDLQFLGGNYLGILLVHKENYGGKTYTYIYIRIYVCRHICTHTFVLVRIKGRTLKRDPSFRKPCGMHIFRAPLR